MRAVLLFLLPYIFLVNSQDDVAVSDNSTNTFDAVSYLFSLVLNLLQEKPEMLERDDVTVFTEDRSYDRKEYDDTSVSDNGVRMFPESNAPSFVGVYQATFGLTPQEVAEQVLKVEKILEEHNKIQ
ncbi:uncharacterized protein LOC116777156 [Danaus plexippus]|uniref:uncharacterized protein LOC116777156 n=1 Tax=Danaus plexippus TaxID=13037 RepID=UPI002AB0BE17|nr:uncharacterized protein LOC116777156 [Danaus plexippus]